MAVALLILMVAMAPTVVSSIDSNPSIVSKLQDEVETLKAKVGKLQSDAETVTAKVGKLQSDAQTVTAKVGKLQSDAETVTAKVALLEQQVYFTATFHSSALTVRGGTVVFNKVLMNTGNAYNPSTGIFTAPRPGLYVFVVQTFINGGGNANWDLYVNGRQVVRGESITGTSFSNGYVYPVTLQTGDKVWVNSRNAINIHGTHHSFFGGWLIKAF